MADEDILIDLPADVEAPLVEKEPKEPVKVETTKTGEDEGVESLRTQFKSLEQRADDERKARERSDQEAQRAREDARLAQEEVAQARTEVVESQAAVIENAIAAAKAEADTAQRDYQAAYDTGDGAKMAESQRRMARAEAKLLRFDEAKEDIATRKAEPAPRREPQRQADPFEQALSKVSPRAQTWFRDHPEYVTDQNKNLQAGAAHNMAVSKGFIPDSDAYFDYCEKFLGLKEEPKVDPQPERIPTKQRTAMPSAPVSRESPTPTNGNLGHGQIVLTPGEQRAATDGSVVWNMTDPKTGAVKGQPVGLKEYARRKAAMTTDGRYDRSYTDQ